MDINTLPKYDKSKNTTGCCPRFNPKGWNEQELHFRDKLFVKAKTCSLFHIPLNMGKVFTKTSKEIEKAQASSDDNFIILSLEKSPWSAEHFFSVKKDVPGQEMTKMSGDYFTKVFNGQYRNMPQWCKELEDLIQKKGKKSKQLYFFYTTCPSCAKVYGENYVVGVGEFE